MNDRYLHRAKRCDNGEWVEGFIGIHTFIPPEKSGKETYLGTVIMKVPERIYDCESYEVDPSTICQCTGLKDKNGKLIWQNDIVRYCDCTVENYVIAWEENKVCFEYQQYGCSIMNFDELSGIEVEAIGNIFDNPELLEVGEFMTDQEAIETLIILKGTGTISGKEVEAIDIIDEAILELEKYRAIGTPEECRAAVERHNERKPIKNDKMALWDYTCPKCGEPLIKTDYTYKFCDMCGQKLDWSDEE